MGESGPTTILAYGALLSETSSRLTFPSLTDFRLARVRGMRRVFAHPHLFLISQGLADPNHPSLRLASLSAEKLDSTKAEGSTLAGFTVAAFEVDLDDSQREAFVERERDYDIVSVPFYGLSDSADRKEEDEGAAPIGTGVICAAGTDDALPALTANSPANAILRDLGRSVWHWERDSGLLPADVYLRHCLLAVKKAGPEAERSFLDETYLADRRTSLREYLAIDGNEGRVMAALPPTSLMTRYNG